MALRGPVRLMALAGSPAGRRPSSAGGVLLPVRQAVAGLAATLAAVGSSTTVLAASQTVPPARDTFSGKITTATGKFAGDVGGVRILLTPGPGQASRHLTATITGTICAHKVACVQLAGRLTGTLAPGPGTNPDVGRRFAIAANGTVRPLGHVSATGSVQGTGFINNGHESLSLRLAATGGTVTIAATSGPVPGFTSP